MLLAGVSTASRGMGRGLKYGSLVICTECLGSGGTADNAINALHRAIRGSLHIHAALLLGKMAIV